MENLCVWSEELGWVPLARWPSLLNKLLTAQAVGDGDVVFVGR